LSFATTVPVNSAGSYGIFSRELGTGTWVLADWHPVLAVFEPGHGWHLDPATPAGDPTHAASSFFDVTFTTPGALTVAASGSEVAERSANGARTERFIAGPAREFTLVVDNDYVVQSDEVDGIAISVYAEPNVAPEIVEQTLGITVRSLTVFGELFGAYPYTELDVVQAPMDGALAVSWSGIIFLNGPAMVDGLALSDPLGYEIVVAHEIAHLWWGATVGSNSNDHTFINEGLATLSSVIYLERTLGAETAAIAREQWLLRPARRLLERGDVVVDQPVSNELDEGVRSAAVYGKGALGFAAIRREIGDDAFYTALHDYARSNQFAIAGPAALRAAFEEAAGRDLGTLWSHWFEEAAMTAEEIASFET
jgi:aminopeptidase N